MHPHICKKKYIYIYILHITIFSDWNIKIENCKQKNTKIMAGFQITKMDKLLVHIIIIIALIRSKNKIIKCK